MTEKTNLLYEGKAKSVYETDNDNLVIVEFRDDMTAGDGARKETMTKKGYYNSIITSKIFEVLEDNGIKTQFIEMAKPSTLVVKKLDMIPLEVIVRNIATGSLVRTFPFEDKTPLNPPIIQTDYKSDEFHDPAINDSISIALGLASQKDLDFIRETALKINDIMKDMFLDAGITLVDFKIEFGKDTEGNIVLGDEISPDSCRLWDVETQDMLDKELFRKGQDDKVMSAYEEVFNRLLSDEDKAKWNL
ncbi:phosphoribosylaminoimidazolesuccinocarboxamide synthase [uncultured Methanobrevibacter sp.]|uniref:phosphoribosylaminoimidazolesuccinocarboxamide synthase n=1 Tax=uncultured Methanobrevibacter sp. TaxID=253161 RepID=UPI0025FF8410|nr:phosphoribosylaminoimidazolesuccinocarboxamide synthase [uncultured Methanobrevibacter sp.]